MDTIVLVTVVPMLAPITIGTAPAKDKAPLLTIPTINEVVVDELWNKTVEHTRFCNYDEKRWQMTHQAFFYNDYYIILYQKLYQL